MPSLGSTPLFRDDGRLRLDVLDGIVAPALRLAQFKIDKVVTMFDFENLPPLDPDAPLVDVTIWARTSDEDGTAERSSVKLARQICSVLEFPPPGIRPDFANVAQLKIVFESASSFRHPLLDRRAATAVLEESPRGSLAVLASINRATRRASDIEPLLARARQNEIRINVQHLPTLEAAIGGEGERVAHSWVDVAANRLDALEHLKYALLLSLEHAFYTDSALVVDRALADAAVGRRHLLDGYRSALTAYAKLHGLDQVVALVRTSQDGSENSLRRQQALIEAVVPATLPTTVVRLDGVSGTKTTGALDALNSLGSKNAMVLFTSVDRLSRTPAHSTALRKLAKDRNLHFIGLVWCARDGTIIVDEVLNGPWVLAVSFQVDQRADSARAGSQGHARRVTHQPPHQAGSTRRSGQDATTHRPSRRASSRRLASRARPVRRASPIGRRVPHRAHRLVVARRPIDCSPSRARTRPERVGHPRHLGPALGALPQRPAPSGLGHRRDVLGPQRGRVLVHHLARPARQHQVCMRLWSLCRRSRARVPDEPRRALRRALPVPLQRPPSSREHDDAAQARQPSAAASAVVLGASLRVASSVRLPVDPLRTACHLKAHLEAVAPGQGFQSVARSPKVDRPAHDDHRAGVQGPTQEARTGCDCASQDNARGQEEVRIVRQGVLDGGHQVWCLLQDQCPHSDRRLRHVWLLQPPGEEAPVV